MGKKGVFMRNRIASKITSIVVFVMMLIIVVMIVSVYFFSKSFYKEHLSHELENRLMVYSSILVGENVEKGGDLSYLIDEKEDLHMVLFNSSFEEIFTTKQTGEKNINHYKKWVQEREIPLNEPLIEHVKSDVNFHIPHIWAVKKIMINGNVFYLFVDQDTGEFQNTQIRLLFLLLSMGMVLFIVGLFLSLYLSKKISLPLQAMGKTTNHIAKGDYEAELNIQSSDEVGALAEDIRLMAKQLKRYRNSRRQLLSHIAHDLRTPLTYIKAYSAVIKDSSQMEEGIWREYIRVIYQESIRMEHLVKDLFELTKLDEGAIQLKKEEVSIVPWMMTVIESKQLVFDQHSISVVLSYDDGELKVKMDKGRMNQVINNLIENSIRYTKGGEIRIHVSSEKESVLIKIQDNGQGIPEKDLPFIWDRFYRVDKSRSSESGGSGLGLSIVKQLVELHQGEITVESQLGKGTTFTINLKKG
jgi:signal transduction histidine kinase